MRPERPGGRDPKTEGLACHAKEATLDLIGSGGPFNGDKWKREAR